MSTSYLVRIRNRAGIRLWDVTDFLSLHYTKYLHDVGTLQVEFAGNHQAIDALEKDGQIEVWRFDSTTGIAPYCDFYGLYRARDRRTPRDHKNGLFTLKAVSPLHFLRRSLIAFPAGVNLRNDFTNDPAETVMKLMVRYNATSEATVVNGRLRDAGSWTSYLTVQSDSGSGQLISKAFAHRNLLEALQDVAVLGGIDFDLVKVGPQAWQFRTYAQLGQDLTGNVKFSLAWDNLDEPSLTGNDIDEATVAIVGGNGEGDEREFGVFVGPNYETEYNDIEIFVDARNQGTASLEAAGKSRLNDLRGRDDFRFNILQQGAYRYGRDYCVGGVLGDWVSVTYYEATAPKRIRGATVSVVTSSGGQSAEQIRLEMVSA